MLSLVSFCHLSVGTQRHPRYLTKQLQRCHRQGAGLRGGRVSTLMGSKSSTKPLLHYSDRLDVDVVCMISCTYTNYKAIIKVHGSLDIGGMAVTQGKNLYF